MTSATWQPLIHGIGFSGFRSFNEGWHPILMPSKVTVLAGQNNSGKSNALRYIEEVLPGLKSDQIGRLSRVALSGLDVPNGFPERFPHAVGMAVPVTQAFLDRFQGERRKYAEKLLEILADDGVYWSRFQDEGQEFRPHPDDHEKAIADWQGWTQHDFRNALHALGGGTIDPNDVMNRLLMMVSPFGSLPSIATIVAARRVDSLPESEAEEPVASDWLSGRGIISALAEIQSPRHGDWRDARDRWQRINRFIQVVLGDNSARINIPFDASTIQVETPQRVLPLSYLGSGVEQVIVLAAAATVTQRHLVCIEEPETNLHPLLQKKLVRYLTDETDNQYLIATHSPHLLDDSRATAYHLRLGELGTEVAPARRPHELAAICHDLGYRPSDLMQANSVIWVEGPADRVYLRAWIELIDAELAEGIDYSIMFYGGKLLNHLTVDESALQDFIDLRRLNRHSAIMIDSDKTGARKSIGSTKQRLVAEFQATPSSPGLAWVTKCYTIENYVPRDILADAVDTIHPGRALTGQDEQWANPLARDAEGRSFDKIAIARRVVENVRSDQLDRWDLREKVTDLVNFIRAANGRSQI